MKTAPTMLQSLPPPNTFSVPAQAPPPSLLQAQLSAASLAPLLQNPPQPLLPQPPPKGRRLIGITLPNVGWLQSCFHGMFLCFHGSMSSCCALLPVSIDVFSGGLLQPPVRMMPQPQPVRRIEPPPRFPSRNDRGPELILRSKEERRWASDIKHLSTQLRYSLKIWIFHNHNNVF